MVKKSCQKPAVWEEPAFLGVNQAHEPLKPKTKATDDKAFGNQFLLDASPKRIKQMTHIKKLRLTDDAGWKAWLENDNCIGYDKFRENEQDNAKDEPTSPRSNALNDQDKAKDPSMHQALTQRTAVLESELVHSLKLSRREYASQNVQDYAGIQRIFLEADSDSSGQIELAEFPKLLAKLLKRVPSSEEVLTCWKEIDRDGNEMITQEEVQLWFCTKFKVECNPDFTNYFDCKEILTEHQRYLRDLAAQFDLEYDKVEEIHKEFKRWDANGSGDIEYNEFLQLMTKLLAVNDTSCLVGSRMEKFFREIDIDSSGKIELEEFVKWYSKYFTGEDPVQHFYNSLGSGWHANWRNNQQKNTRLKAHQQEQISRQSTFADFGINVASSPSSRQSAFAGHRASTSPVK